MADDYYNILGITKGASAADIKKAYRKLALKYHPDKTKGDKALEDKFKKISEAYAVLSDPEKKQQYDTYGSADFQQRFSQEDIFRNFDLGDILKEFGFGGDERRISTTDADGVALAAIQGLNAKLEKENAELRGRLKKLERVVGRLTANQRE